MGLWNNIKGKVKFLHSVGEIASRQFDPKKVNANRATLTKFYKEYFEVATKESAHPKVVQLAHDLEEMLLHPLSKKGLKGKPAPKIYVVKSLLPTAFAKSPEVIELSQQTIDVCDPKELKAIAGHELAHILRGNLDATIAMPGELASNQAMERGADRLGVILSGEGEAMKTGLQKVSEVTNKGLVDIMAKVFSDRPWLKKLSDYRDNRAMKYGSRTYPSLPSRGHSIDKVASQLLTPEGRNFVEAEEMRRLEEIHGRRK